jgi:hypothetical protein
VKRLLNPDAVRSWGYFDQRLGKGFSGTKQHIAMQVQNAYLRAGIDFQEKEIPARIEHFMCEQGIGACTERVEGLGDIVHAIAHPFVKAVDHVFKTDFAHCKGCAERQKALNELAPL